MKDRIFFFRTSIIFTFYFLATVVVAQPSDSNRRIGVIIPLTGPVADYGAAVKNGISLAQQDKPELLSKIKFIYEDSQYDNRLALTAFQKLTQIDKVKLVFVWGSGPTQAVAPIAEAQHVPLLGLTSELDVTRGRQYVIRFFVIADEYIRHLIPYLREHRYKKIGLIKSQLTFFNEMEMSLRSQLRSDESLEVEDWVSSDSDFKSVISRIKGKHYDALGVFLLGGQLSQFYLQAAAHKLELPTFGTNTLESRHDFELSKGAMLGAVYPTVDASDDFHRRYQEKFGNDVQHSFAAHAYDFASLCGEVFKDLPQDAKGDEIIKAFAETHEQQGMTGKFKYAANKETGMGFDFAVTLRRVTSNGFVDLE